MALAAILLQATHPVGIAMVAVIACQWIGPLRRHDRGSQPKIELPSGKLGTEKITVVVAAATIASENSASQILVAYHHTRTVAKTARLPHRLSVIDRRIEQAAVFQRVIPIARGEQIPVGRPNPSGRIPHPTRAVPHPAPCPPDPAITPPGLATRRPEHVHRWRRDGRTSLRHNGWHFRHHHIGSVCRLPISRLPAPTTAVVLAEKATCNPSPPRRHLTPKTADPDEIVARIIEVPVARDPSDAITLGPSVGWILCQWLGGFSWDKQVIVGWSALRYLGVGLMNHPALGRCALLIHCGGNLARQSNQTHKHERLHGFLPVPGAPERRTIAIHLREKSMRTWIFGQTAKAGITTSLIRPWWQVFVEQSRQATP